MTAFPRLKLRGVCTRAVVVPIKRPLRTGGGAVTQAPLVLIDLDTEEGITGRAYVFGFGVFALKPLAAVIEGLGAMIAGDSVAPLDLDRKLRSRLTLLGPHNLTGIALAGLDM